jgi:CheY-like chemotaxis protein
MNGSVAVKRLRQHGYEGLVVGVTGSALEEDLNAFCAAGVDYALPKPFVIEDFIDILNLC